MMPRKKRRTIINARGPERSGTIIEQMIGSAHLFSFVLRKKVYIFRGNNRLGEEGIMCGVKRCKKYGFTAEEKEARKQEANEEQARYDLNCSKILKNTVKLIINNS